MHTPKPCTIGRMNSKMIQKVQLNKSSPRTMGWVSQKQRKEFWYTPQETNWLKRKKATNSRLSNGSRKVENGAKLCRSTIRSWSISQTSLNFNWASSGVWRICMTGQTWAKWLDKCGTRSLQTFRAWRKLAKLATEAKLPKLFSR